MIKSGARDEDDRQQNESQQDEIHLDEIRQNSSGQARSDDNAYLQDRQTPVLEFHHVSFQYDSKTKVLENIDLAMGQGDFLGVVGPNGSGKSTLIKLLLGLLQPDSGKVNVFGQPVHAFHEWSRIGYVSQKANSFNAGFPATVYEVVSSGLFGKLGLFRWLGREERRQVHRVIEMVGMSAYAHRNIGKLSGGQQQRTFIARALVSNPDFLILDEPTVGVDAESMDRFYQLLEHLHEQEHVSILLVTHDIGVITSKVSRVACLNRKLFFHGDPSEFEQNQESILASAYGHDIHLLDHSH